VYMWLKAFISKWCSKTVILKYAVKEWYGSNKYQNRCWMVLSKSKTHTPLLTLWQFYTGNIVSLQSP